MRRDWILAAAAVLAVLFGVGAAARAAEPAIAVEQPWARASIGAARPAVAYLTLRNTGTEPDRLVGVASPIAQEATLHRIRAENGVMKMEPAGAVELPPGETVRLQPGGLHIMLMGLHEPLEEGGHFPLTLRFAHAGAITIEVPVLGVGASGPGHARHDHGQPEHDDHEHDDHEHDHP